MQLSLFLYLHNFDSVFQCKKYKAFFVIGILLGQGAKFKLELKREKLVENQQIWKIFCKEEKGIADIMDFVKIIQQKLLSTIKCLKRSLV